jgi:phosphatidylglycerol lysyltransferase
VTPGAHNLDRARELVLSYGWNATSYQVLNPGIDHWFSSAMPAVVGYTRRDRLLLVAGAPACPPKDLPAVCDEFERFARDQDCGVCYVCAEERLRSVFLPSRNHVSVALGAQPVWDPRRWRRLVQGHASLRAQLNRSRNKAVVIEPMAPEQAARHPDLEKVLHEWLRARRLPPLHFLVEPGLLRGVVTDRIVLVAKRDGRTVAFLVASPVAAKEGYLVELLARSPAAPNGTSELLIDAVMERLAREDRGYVTLGLVALADAARAEIRGNPLWLRFLMEFARLHANRFYNFRGLEHFRVKMLPGHWEPIYAISNERRFSVRTLYGIGAAFAGIPPWLAIGIGATKAVRQELQTLLSRARRKRGL